MAFTGTIAALATVLLGAQNLLSNPGFEQTSGDAPAAWNRFVQPQPGAIGRLDAECHSGTRAALLHTPMPYPKEPINNWSQNIYGAFSGKKLEARAHIRTVDAGQAALWVQCWTRGERFPHAVFTTAEKAPLSGTHPWEEVAFECTPPAGTDFLTLRCVLMGTGSVWFDDLYLGEVETPAAEGDKESKAAASPEAAPQPQPQPKQDYAEEIAALREEIEKLKKAHYILAGAVEELRRQLRERQSDPPTQEQPARVNETLVDENK